MLQEWLQSCRMAKFYMELLDSSTLHPLVQEPFQLPIEVDENVAETEQLVQHPTEI